MTIGAFLPFIIIAATMAFFGVVIFLVFKNMQTKSNDDTKTNSTGFFRGLLDEISSEFGEKQSAKHPAHNEKPAAKTAKEKAQSIAAGAQTAKSITIAPPLEIEAEEDKNDLLDEILEDENIMAKLVLGEMIFTPRSRRKNIRRLY